MEDLEANAAVRSSLELAGIEMDGDEPCRFGRDTWAWSCVFCRLRAAISSFCHSVN